MNSTHHPASSGLDFIARLVGIAFLSFVLANLIHNGLRVDLAVAPALCFGLLYRRKGWRWSLWATAFVIALPALAFVRPDALRDPSDPVFFANHLALLVAGVLAASALAGDLARSLRRLGPIG